MQSQDAVKGLHIFREFSHPQLPPKYLNGAICVLTWKKYIAFSYHKYHNHVYILPSKHTYSIAWPIQAHMLS